MTLLNSDRRCEAPKGAAMSNPSTARRSAGKESHDLSRAAVGSCSGTIDPANGHVVGRIDLPGLINQYAKGYSPDNNEVLNGIAWDSTSKKIYITGKHWPKMFEGTLN